MYSIIATVKFIWKLIKLPFSKKAGSCPDKVMIVFGLATAMRVLPLLRQWDVDVEVGLGQMRKTR